MFIQAVTKTETDGVMNWTRLLAALMSVRVIMTVVWTPIPARVLLVTFVKLMPIACLTNVHGVMERTDVRYLPKILVIGYLVTAILSPIWIILHVTTSTFAECLTDVHLNVRCLIVSFHR